MRISANLVVLSMLTLFTTPWVVAEQIPLIPKPRIIKQEAGAVFPLPDVISVAAPTAWEPHINLVAEHVRRISDGRHQVELAEPDTASLVVRQVDAFNDSQYVLDLTTVPARIEASSRKGLAHATATLLQLIGGSDSGQVPKLRIEDQPSASYRSFMIDMGRNPHSFELLKETIDLLWFYKIDSLHLHLTDDQRFAWPSIAFPKLWDGEISLEEFRELESYASNRGVTIIPELEVPGHSGRLRSAYPEVFGKEPKELTTRRTALDGIKVLLDEMMEVFKSTPYVHIGGDEAFGVPEELQRDLINQLHEYLQSKGRQTIVWEGPRVGEGDNKVHTDVIHINWRTIAYPADSMLRDGYRVVNAAWDPLYVVDHYPRINFTMTTPQHIYETLQLTRFKHVNPGIPTFARPIEVEPSDRLVGFCMPWWEGREENFFAQNVPRLIPFADVAWNPEVERDFSGFSERVANTERARLAAFYPISMKATDLAVPEDLVFHEQTSVTFKGSMADSDVSIRYTLDGTPPTSDSPQYSGPLQIKQSTNIRAAAFVGGKQIGHGVRHKLTAVEPVKNLALGKPVSTTATSASPFSIGRLTDGGIGNLDFYLGYPAEPKPIQVTVDLQSTHAVDRVVVYAYSISDSFERYTVEVSENGMTFEKVGAQSERPEKTTRPRRRSAVPVEYTFPRKDVRYVRITTNGNKGYVFDSFSKLVEIQVFGPTDEKGAEPAGPLSSKPIDYSKLAFYPQRWRKAGVDFDMLAWEGTHVVFVTRKGEYDPKLLTTFVRRLDEGWQAYSELIGQQPRALKTFNGKPVICAIPNGNLSCGYGCGYVGATGIEASAFYSIDLPNFKKDTNSFQHYYFYEMGRNFFVFGDRHSLFTTGYAVFMRYVCMDRLQCRDFDARTRKTIEDCEEIYANSDLGFYDAFTNLGSGEKANRLRRADGGTIRPSDQPVMYATAMLKLRKDYGGDAWVKKFFHALRRCDAARARDIASAKTQVFNWLVCASLAAEQDLTVVFADRWRMPLTDNQRLRMKQTDWSDADLDVRKTVALLVADEPVQTQQNYNSDTKK